MMRFVYLLRRYFIEAVMRDVKQSGEACFASV